MHAEPRGGAFKKMLDKAEKLVYNVCENRIGKAMTKTDEAGQPTESRGRWKPGGKRSQDPIPSELEARTSYKGQVDVSRDCRVSA